MTFEDKKKVFNTLGKHHINELKDVLEDFENHLWLTEPSINLFGVTWTHSDLNKLINL